MIVGSLVTGILLGGCQSDSMPKVDANAKAKEVLDAQAKEPYVPGGGRVADDQ
ncbi:MAG: hypothetical protein SFX74_02590 [Fimbriimonadaceae bacterium]|nr:hypothetical protein [Fimbriimonadaceae bacterium]